MQKIVREEFDAQIGIWGSVERVAGREADIYDLVDQVRRFLRARRSENDLRGARRGRIRSAKSRTFT